MKDASPDDVKEAQRLMGEVQQEKPDTFTSRDQKIAEHKAKKQIEEALNMLKDYKDE